MESYSRPHQSKAKKRLAQNGSATAQTPMMDRTDPINLSDEIPDCIESDMCICGSSHRVSSPRNLAAHHDEVAKEEEDDEDVDELKRKNV